MSLGAPLQIPTLLWRNRNWIPCLFCKGLSREALKTVKTPCNFLWGHVFINISIIQPSGGYFEISLIFGIETPKMYTTRLWILVMSVTVILSRSEASVGTFPSNDYDQLAVKMVSLLKATYKWEVTSFFSSRKYKIISYLY